MVSDSLREYESENNRTEDDFVGKLHSGSCAGLQKSEDGKIGSWPKGRTQWAKPKLLPHGLSSEHELQF